MGDEIVRVTISTVGVSLWRNNLDLEKAKILMGRPASEMEQFSSLINQLCDDTVRKVLYEDFDPVTFSAETHSLYRIGVSEGDYAAFLTSDTLDGILCGKILTGICKRKWKMEASYHVVKGLQVRDADMFRKEGVNHLVDQIMHLLDKYPSSSYKVVLNPTGGYKAIVPYITLMGLIEGIPVKYIYEQSKVLMELPVAPISFNLDTIKDLGPVAADLATDYITTDQFCEMMGANLYYLQQKFRDILYFEDGHVTLSALARLLYLRFLYKEGQQIELSKTVRKKLQQFPTWKNKFESLFEKMRNPLYRQAHIHNEVQSSRVDLDCFKQGNVAERIFYFVEGEKVYICDIFLHDEYDRELNTGNLMKSKYMNDFDVPVGIKV
mgnify:CR=1 FL=1